MQPNYPYIKRLMTQLRNEVYAQTDTEEIEVWHEFADQFGQILRPLVEMVNILDSDQGGRQTWNGVLNAVSVASEPFSGETKIARLAQRLCILLQPFFEADARLFREELWFYCAGHALRLRGVIEPFTLEADQRDKQFKFASIARKVEVVASKVLEEFVWP